VEPQPHPRMWSLPLVLLASLVQGELTLGLHQPLHLQLAQEPLQLGPLPAPIQPLRRIKRQDCAQVHADHGTCVSGAYADYQAAWAEGDDGRPDWVARKTCNYLTGSIDVCGNGLMEGGCSSEEEVNRMKDQQMRASLNQVRDNVHHWDSTKCPPVKAYMQRAGLVATPRPDCARIQEEHKNCTTMAYHNYQAVFALGNDGREHWVARKTCNYLTEAIDVCGDGLLKDGCMTEDTLAKQKDKQVSASLQRVKGQVESWDSTKCPVVRTYLEHLGLLPSSSSGVGARFGGHESTNGTYAEEDFGENWGLKAYFYYWWAALTGQADRFNRAWAAFMEEWSRGY